MVRLASRRAGLRNFRDYRIRGDDIVIAHPDVSREYLSLAEELNLALSKQKTLSSERDGYGIAEFAKRIYRRGCCLNKGFTLKQLVSALHVDPFGLLEIVPDISSWIHPKGIAYEKRSLHSVCTLFLATRFRSRVEMVVDYLMEIWHFRLRNAWILAGVDVGMRLVPHTPQAIRAVTLLLLQSVVPEMGRKIQHALEKLIPKVVGFGWEGHYRKALILDDACVITRLRYEELARLALATHPVFRRGSALVRELQRLDWRFVYDQASKGVWPTSKTLEIVQGLTTLDVSYRDISRKSYRRHFSAKLARDLRLLLLRSGRMYMIGHPPQGSVPEPEPL
jgi:hypothetical protein